MEQTFQTSFIPKKPLAPEKAPVKHSASIVTVISIFIFFAVAILSGGMYFYKGVLVRQLDQKSADLIKARNRFEPEKIQELQELDKRLTSATDILARHVAISPIFKILEDLTLKSIRFTKFSYALDPSNQIKVSMGGQAVGYKSIALQSDLFSLHKKEIIDPVFSNLTLDAKGNVLFDLNFSVSPSFVNYKELVLGETSLPPIEETPIIPPAGDITTNPNNIE